MTFECTGKGSSSLRAMRALTLYPDGQLAAETAGYGTGSASTTSYCYDPNGNRTATVVPDGNVSGVAPCQRSLPWTVSSAFAGVRAIAPDAWTARRVGRARD